jgi:WD40 repeat protein
MRRCHAYSVLNFVLVLASLCCGLSTHAQDELAKLRLDAPISIAAVSPDGRYVAANLGRSVQMADGSWKNNEFLEVLDLSASKVVARVDIPSVKLVSNAPAGLAGEFLGYCDSGKYLVSFDSINTVYVLDASSYRVESTFDLGGMTEPANGIGANVTMACSATAPLFAVGGYGGRLGVGVVRVYDIVSGKEVDEVRQDAAAEAEFGEIAISPDGSKLAILLKDRRWNEKLKGPNIQIRDGKSLKLVSDFSTGDSPQGLIFAGESEVVTVNEQPSRSSSKQALRLWDVQSGHEERQLADAQLDVEGPISSSANGRYILASIVKYHLCRFCNGMEGRLDVKQQKFAVWDKETGAQVFQSAPYGPIIEPLGARPVVSQDGSTALVYWPHSGITPRLLPIQKTAK